MPADAAEIVRLDEWVEQATGPDRELECRIWCESGAAGVSFAWAIAALPDLDLWSAPRYTVSLDAAMTLVPSGFMWRLQSWPDGVNSALLEKNAGDFGAIDARHTEAFAATPALALTAAALRARAAQHDHEVG